MREIKFRAWDMKHYRMINVIALGFLSKEVIGSDCALTIDKDCELMQYTGLKDKNGKDIYEGDILKYDPDGNDPLIGEVAFKNGKFIQIINECDYPIYKGKVIGNIYENPELLNKEA